MPYIVLDPDGSQKLGLTVIVEAKTGVTYANQCAGYLCEQRRLEGFIIPLGNEEMAQRVYDWYWSAFGGWSYLPNKNRWPLEKVEQLAELIASIRCWYTCEENADDRLEFLQLDRSRIEECVEAWIPVLTPYGKAILTLYNSD